LRALRDASGCAWIVRLNGTQLKPADYKEKPIDHPYNAFLGKPENYACFSCPAGTVGDGLNQLAITLDRGDPMPVEYLDLVLGA
jgi:hypothetical protein